MKLGEYLKILNSIVEENPENINLEVIYSSDDEGNNHHIVHNEPAVGKVEDLSEFFLELEGFDDEVEEHNIICIN